jgi:two-component system, OmpR family, KDP operon response regulator KdpE
VAEAPDGGLSGLVALASAENEQVTAACKSLTTVGVSAVHVSSLDDALTVVQRAQPDLLAVEVGAGYPEGVDAVSRLRFVTSLPIVAIALPEDGAVVARALEGGADGYLTAFPSTPDELRDRLAAMRQTATQRGPSPVSLARVRDLTVDFDRFQATLSGQALSLTPTEFRLLAALVRAAGRVISARELLAEAQGGLLPDSEAREIVKVHMRRLRGKLEPHQRGNQYIASVRGFGYLLERRAAPRPGDFLAGYLEYQEA